MPRLPLVPDPLRRIDVPKDLDAVTTVGHEEDPAAGGMDRRAVESIWDAARALYQTGVHPAVQLCLRRNGRVLIDRAIGHARGNGPGESKDARTVLATPETPFCVYSTSKAVTAMVVHMLHERGALDIDDRVAKHIPEYACNGKGETTIAQVLSHRAGIPSMPREALRIENVNDRELMLRLITELEPSSKPGDVLAYHTLTGGFILAEVVARTTGKSIRDVLHDEVLGPLGFRFCNYGVADEDVDAVGLSYVTGPPLPPPVSWLVTRALGAPLDEVIELSNDPRFLTAIVPSASVIASANELSRFFEIFRRGGELDGVQVMAPDTVRRAVSEQSRLEIDMTLIFPTRFSYGLMLGAKVVSLYGLDTDSAFGHLGLINIMGWADPERGLSAALITSGKAILYPELPRFYGVMNKIAALTPKVAADERAL
jgi:CubicO group peptidase (beta-lactamase class C family)